MDINEQIEQGLLPNEQYMDGVLRIDAVKNWFYTRIRGQTCVSAAFRKICTVAEGDIIRLSPARQLNYGYYTTYPSQYALMTADRLYRAWSDMPAATIEQYEANLAAKYLSYRNIELEKSIRVEQANYYCVSVEYDIEECPVCIDAPAKKICRECQRGYSCGDCTPLTHCPYCRVAL